MCSCQKYRTNYVASAQAPSLRKPKQTPQVKAPVQNQNASKNTQTKSIQSKKSIHEKKKVAELYNYLSKVYRKKQ
jgi:hypothetical protein